MRFKRGLVMHGTLVLCFITVGIAFEGSIYSGAYAGIINMIITYLLYIISRRASRNNIVVFLLIFLSLFGFYVLLFTISNFDELNWAHTAIIREGYITALGYIYMAVMSLSYSFFSIFFDFRRRRG